MDDNIPPEVVEMEFKALEYAISAGFPLQLPGIMQNIHKKYETGIKIHINSLNRLLLMIFIDGKQLEMMPDISDILFKNVGISLAQYNLAMRGFDHPATRRSHRWNLNILVRGDRVTGLVDFGDSCFNPAVCDLAICLSYVMMGQDNPNWFGSEELAWDLLQILRYVHD